MTHSRKKTFWEIHPSFSNLQIPKFSTHFPAKLLYPAFGSSNTNTQSFPTPNSGGVNDITCTLSFAPIFLTSAVRGLNHHTSTSLLLINEVFTAIFIPTGR